MHKFVATLVGTVCLVACGASAQTKSPTATLKSLDSIDAREIGTVVFKDTAYGIMIEPRLSGLQPGPHAAHVHVNPSCETMPHSDHSDHSMSAGGPGDHYDPDSTKKHAGPYGDGHKGDLPNLIAEQDGSITIPTVAPRLKAEELRGRALIIHAGADRYGEHEGHQHGTGGERMYCGVIK